MRITDSRRSYFRPTSEGRQSGRVRCTNYFLLAGRVGPSP